MKIKNELIFRYFFNVIVPLVLGILIYIFVRPDTYISQCFYRVLNVLGQSSKRYVLLPRWIRILIGGYGADILWAYALTYAVFSALQDVTNSLLPVIMICVLFEAGIEFMQMFPAVSGTFDWWDIILEICATAIASLIIKKHREEKK